MRESRELPPLQEKHIEILIAIGIHFSTEESPIEILDRLLEIFDFYLKKQKDSSFAELSAENITELLQLNIVGKAIALQQPQAGSRKAFRRTKNTLITLRLEEVSKIADALLDYNNEEGHSPIFISVNLLQRLSGLSREVCAQVHKELEIKEHNQTNGTSVHTSRNMDWSPVRMWLTNNRSKLEINLDRLEQ